MSVEMEMHIDGIRELQEKLTHSVWNTGGCSSYYLSPSGRNYTFWPGFVVGFRRRMKHIRLADFTVRRIDGLRLVEPVAHEQELIG